MTAADGILLTDDVVSENGVKVLGELLKVSSALKDLNLKSIDLLWRSVLERIVMKQ